MDCFPTLLIAVSIMLSITLSRPAVLALAIVSVTCDPHSVLDVFASTPSLSIVASLVHGFPEYSDALSNITNITLFAPSDEAFVSLNRSDPQKFASLEHDLVGFSGIIAYHVLFGVHKASELDSMPYVFYPTAIDDAIATNVTGNQTLGVRSFPHGRRLLGPAQKTSDTIETDLTFARGTGVVHVVDRVFPIPYDLLTTLKDVGLTSFAQALARYEDIASLVIAPDTTIFAPTNTAFDNASPHLSRLDDDGWRNLISSHLVLGEVARSNPAQNKTLGSRSGEKIELVALLGETYVNEAKVVTSDIITANGVVHSIDSVLY